jgi:hypothetical protein
MGIAVFAAILSKVFFLCLSHLMGLRELHGNDRGQLRPGSPWGYITAGFLLMLGIPPMLWLIGYGGGERVGS